MGVCLPRIRKPHEKFGNCFKEVESLDDFTKMLDYTNGALIIIKGYGDRIHLILLQTFNLENSERIDDFAKAYAHHIGESTMKALYDELKDLLEGGNVDG